MWKLIHVKALLKGIEYYENAYHSLESICCKKIDKSQNDFRRPLSLELEIKRRAISKFNNCFAILILKILQCPQLRLVDVTWWFSKWIPTSQQRWGGGLYNFYNRTMLQFAHLNSGVSVDLSVLECLFHNKLLVWPWISYLTFMPQFSFCKMEKIIVPIS